MEAIIFSKAQHEAMLALLQQIMLMLQKHQKIDPLPIVDNHEFCQKLKVSRRTSQAWRDEGKITFSQIGSKIYYKCEDILQFLEQNQISTKTKFIKK
jgi:hypothetical protein